MFKTTAVRNDGINEGSCLKKAGKGIVLVRNEKNRR
jgi:hypothetical protein